MTNDPRPVYQRIAEEIRDHIASGAIPEGQRAPSTNELSTFHSVNPATAAKALTFLHQEGLVEKRRGLGMFVTPGARERVLDQRRTRLARDYIRPLLRETASLGLSTEELLAAIEKERNKHDHDAP